MLFAILYVSLILNLTLILSHFVNVYERPYYHVQLINLMLKRITDSSLAWASNGGNFSQYLTLCLNELSRYYPIIVTVLNYSLSIDELSCQTSVTYLVSYLPFNFQYRLKCTSSFGVSILTETSASSPSPFFKSKLIKLKLFSDESFTPSSIVFSALYFDGFNWRETYVSVKSFNAIYSVVLTVPLNATILKLVVGDWRGIVITITLEI